MAGRARDGLARALQGAVIALSPAGLLRFCVESRFRDAFGPLSGLPCRPLSRASGAAFSGPRPGPSAPCFRARCTHYLLMPKSLDRGYNM